MDGQHGRGQPRVSVVIPTRNEARNIAPADRDVARARRVVGPQSAIRVTHDIDDVFNDESVEAVATATRPATHAELASRCLEAGRHLVRERLRELAIGTGVHHPTPIHLQPAYAHLGPGFGAFPEAECSAARVLSLPMYPEPSDAQVDRVAEALRAATDEA